MAFGSYRLDDGARVLEGPDGPIHLERQVFDVLLHLLVHRARVVPKEELLDEIWGDRFVSESTLTSRIKAARRAIGDDGRAQHSILTVHGVGYRFVAEVESADGTGPRPQQQIRYCRSPDGVRVAYATSGTGPPLVKAANWLTHLDLEWSSPRRRRRWTPGCPSPGPG